MGSGLYYPNRFVRITLQALQDVIGATGMKAIYSLSGVSQLLEALPPDDMERQFDFADFSNLFGTLQTMFGVRGAHSLAVRAGRSTFKEGMRVFDKFKLPGMDAGTGPIGAPGLLIRLNRLSNFLNTISDQHTFVHPCESEYTFEFGISICPVCINRTSTEPICSFFEGLLTEAACSFSGGSDFSAIEIQCHAAGAENCLFEIKPAAESEKPN